MLEECSESSGPSLSGGGRALRESGRDDAANFVVAALPRLLFGGWNHPPLLGNFSLVCGNSLVFFAHLYPWEEQC